MDHVGTRVTRAEDCYRWYAKTLGFTRSHALYFDLDPLQNWETVCATVGNKWILI
jgi:catechol 2,3-dioxygenase-like lactoylglutathione lyase family enzyme